jgi:branched-chain amino acid transport system permease protein
MRAIFLYVLLAVLTAVFIPFLPAYGVFITNLLLMYAVLALGLDVLLGLAGQFAFAHVAFFGVGIYVSALLGNRYDISFPGPLLAGAVLSGVLAVLIAVPALRLRQVYLALTTYAFAAAAQWVFHSWDSVTQGSNGLRISPANLFGWHIIDDRDAYPLLLLVAIAMLVLRLALERSRLGLRMAAVHESEPIALAAGINARQVKVIAFGISGVFAGVAGGMLPLFNSYVHPDSLGLETLVVVLTMVVVGGLGSVWGVLAGVLVMGLLPEVMRDLQVLREIAYGSVLILAVMFMPRGIAGLRRS